MADTHNSGKTLLAAGFMPVAPGPYLESYVIRPYGHSISHAAARMGLTVEVLGEVVKDRRPIDRPLADKLAAYSETSPEFWLNMQSAWDYARLQVSPEERSSYLSVPMAPRGV